MCARISATLCRSAAGRRAASSADSPGERLKRRHVSDRFQQHGPQAPSDPKLQAPVTPELQAPVTPELQAPVTPNFKRPSPRTSSAHPPNFKRPSLPEFKGTSLPRDLTVVDVSVSCQVFLEKLVHPLEGVDPSRVQQAVVHVVRKHDELVFDVALRGAAARGRSSAGTRRCGRRLHGRAGRATSICRSTRSPTTGTRRRFRIERAAPEVHAGEIDAGREQIRVARERLRREHAAVRESPDARRVSCRRPAARAGTCRPRARRRTRSCRRRRCAAPCGTIGRSRRRCGSSPTCTM